ncbi:MAG TPA: sigma 54-interacting transcriptional regulator [Polyangia bacterium]|nr:sigma 54-interacting transcriptional regulator [Polyangia bacterium]
MSETRVISRSAGTVSVRRARLRVSRGPNKGRELELGGLQPALLGSHPDADLQLEDDTVSRNHAEVRATPLGYVIRDLGSTNGVWIGELRVLEAVLGERAKKLSLGNVELEFKLLDDEVAHAQSTRPFGRLLGQSAPMRELAALLEQAAGSDSTVLIEGESGSGKEVVAESLHQASPRADGPFVIVDCGALAPTLVESELFGHEKGAFTGADRARTGALEEASGGTLFLDEIGELPIEMQVKLLRALEARHIRRLGSNAQRPIDVRVIAATHRKLARLVADGKFRSDLYYRLAVIKVQVPALRHRAEDILPLAHHFLAQLRPDREPEEILSDAVASALTAHAWPGNVRELRNVVERLALVGELDTRLRAGKPRAPDEYHAARQDAIERFEKEYCKALLQHAGGVVARAAQHAGISRQMLHRLLTKHELRGT